MQEEQKWDEVYKRLDSLTQEVMNLGDVVKILIDEIVNLGNAFAELVEWCGRNLPVKYVDDYINHLKAGIRELKRKR